MDHRQQALLLGRDYHALLSPSKSAVWLACTRAPRLTAGLPDDAGPAAKQGSFAHALREVRLLQWLEQGDMQAAPSGPEMALRATSAGREWMTGELSDDVNGSIRRAIIEIAKARQADPNATILVEQRLFYDDWVPEGSGVADLAIIANGVCFVDDFKYGMKWVEVVDNSQLRLLALGAVQTFRDMYEFDTVRVRIDQPRRNHLDEATFSVKDLLEWADTLVKPRAELAWKGEGAITPGSHCADGYCKLRFTCATRLNRAFSVAEVSDQFKLMSEDELAGIAYTDQEFAATLPKIDEAIRTLEQMKSFAYRQTIEQKGSWSTMKLVRGRRHTVIDLEPFEVAFALDAELTDVVKPMKLRGVTELRVLAGGPKQLNKALGEDNIHLVPGPLALVPMDDKRVAWSPPREPEDDFDDEEDIDAD